MSEGSNYRPPFEPIRLFLTSSDPIFQLGLQIGLEQQAAFQVVGMAADADELWPTVARVGLPEIFVLDLDPRGRVDPALIILCRELKQRYQLPVVVISGLLESGVVAQLQQIGVKGYAAKGSSLDLLCETLQGVMQGELSGSALPSSAISGQVSNSTDSPDAVSGTQINRFKASLRRGSVQHIRQRRQQLSQDLASERIAWWQWVVLSGQLREVKAAQFLVERLFPVETWTAESPSAPQWPSIPALTPTLKSNPDELASEQSYRVIKSAVLDQLTARLPAASVNLTGTPLEIDFLRTDKKQELCLIVLKRFEDLLDELRFSGVIKAQLFEKRGLMLRDLWQNALIDFLGKYRTIKSSPQSDSATGLAFVEVVPVLLLDIDAVEANMLRQIPLFAELVDHLIFHSELLLDQQVYPVGSMEAFLQTEALLANTVIQVANAVVQPLVNRFSADDSIRRDFFDRRWLSTREIERFRNALSWKYRVQQWFVAPKDIFESQHRLMVFSETGIKYRAIYAPRDQELRSLSGLPFIITLALEARDAVMPPIQATVTFLGRGFVYLLTQIIGRSIGLVGRGVLQGVGYVRSEVRRPPSADQWRP